MTQPRHHAPNLPRMRRCRALEPMNAGPYPARPFESGAAYNQQILTDTPTIAVLADIGSR